MEPQPSRAGHDVVCAAGEEGVYVPSRHRPSRFQVAGVQVQRPAAALSGRDCHLAAVAGQCTNCRLHRRALHQRHHAARKQGYPLPLCSLPFWERLLHSLPLRGRVRVGVIHAARRPEEAAAHPGQLRFQFPQTSRQQTQQAGAADNCLHTQLLANPKQTRAKPHQARTGQRQPQKPAVHPLHPCRLPPMSPHLRPGPLHHPPIGDARGADCLAGPAVEAGLPVGNDALADFHPPLVDRLHQSDAPPRRLHLQPGHAVGGAGTETQTAVNTAVHIGFRRSVGGVEPGEHCRQRSSTLPLPVGEGWGEGVL